MEHLHKNVELDNISKILEKTKIAECENKIAEKRNAF